MRAFLAVTALFLATSVLAKTAPRVAGLEHSKSLGHGYWLLTIAQRTGGFESIGHFQHCYFKRTDLGKCNSMTPSPFGKLAIFQAAASGYIILFDSANGSTRRLTETFPGLMWSADWKEDQGSVSVRVDALGPERSVTSTIAGHGES